MEAIIKLLFLVFFLGGIVLLASLLFFLPVYFLWNWLMPVVFGLPEISMLQAWGLTVLCSLLFKSADASSD